MEYLTQLLIICPLAFFAGFVDSIAGGGGLISLPAYFAAGIPPHMALGTNKFVASCGTSIAAWRFIKNKRVHIKTALTAGLAALAGSVIGAQIALNMSDVFLRYVLLVALPLLAVFMLVKKDFVADEAKKKLEAKQALWLSGIAGFIIGGYDGFFGPGTGTFLIIVFHAVIGLDLLTASGNAKVVNLASGMAAFVTFLINGKVIFAIGIPAMICGIAGNYLGSGLALSRGTKVIKPAFIVVLTLLLCKIAYDLFSIGL